MMELRPDLRFPTLDDALVDRLARLASTIDGARPGEWEDELAEFNRLTGTSLGFLDFQGISGGAEHDTWVRNMLSLPFAECRQTLSREEMLEIITRLCTAGGEEHEQFFWIKLLEANLDPRISDLIYWPGKYFGDGNDSRVMSPEEILETAWRARS